MTKMTKSELFYRRRSQISFGALEAIEAAATFTGLTGDQLREEIGSITTKWRKDLVDLREAMNAAPDAIQASGPSAVEDTGPSEVQLEAVANANAHLNNAGLPTILHLNSTISSGPSQVIGFDRNGQRQEDYCFGWNSAMGHVWNAMQGTVVTQRAINNAESDR